MKAERKLFEIKPSEVSLVNRPANKRFFLFHKQGEKPKISIESDGTIAGTILQINGKEIEKLAGFNFGYYPNPGNEGNCFCDYSVIVETEDGFKRIETYNLMKGDPIMDELLKCLQEYFGKDYQFAKKELSEEAVKALKDAISAINKFKDQFPKELKDAIGVLAEYATSYGYSESEDEDKDSTKKTDDKNTDGNNAVTKSIAELAELVKGLKDEMTKNSDVVKANGESLTAITKRLEVVETATKDKSSISGQDDVKKGAEEKVEDNFPSWKIA